MISSRTPHSIFVALAIVLFGGAEGVSAQAVRGVVVDDESLAHVTSATVRLVQDGKLGQGTETDADGRFFIGLPGDGAYSLEVSRLGYQTTRSQVFMVEGRDTVSVEFRVAPHAVLLDPIVVTARSRRGRNLFAERRKDWGKGVFLAPYQIDSMNLRAPAEVFRKMPEVQLKWDFGVRGNGSRGTIPTVISDVGTGCVLYMLNNVFVQPPSWAKRVDLVGGAVSDKVIANASKTYWSSWQLADLLPEDIAAVEAYRSMDEVPPKLRRFTHDGPLTNCGLVVFWTKSAW